MLDYRHPDLAPNIDANWLAEASAGNRAGEGTDGNYSTHATLVAGVMVAANNGEGAVGVAYGATVAGHWISSSDLGALRKMTWYDIANNSWTAHPSFDINFDNNPGLRSDFQYAAVYGRGGLGTAMVMAPTAMLKRLLVVAR